MTKISSSIALAGISVDRQSSLSFYRQLYQALRQAILRGQLGGGTRLPSTRALATELGVSRNTVLNAFDQLIAEGYLEGKTGAGTYVTHALPDDVLQVQSRLKKGAKTPQNEAKQVSLSKRGLLIAQTPPSMVWRNRKPCAFRPGLPDLDTFPVKLWERIMLRCWRTLSSSALSYGHAAGYWPLREAIATYLSIARGVRCSPEQVIVVAGAQQAIDLVAKVLLDPGDAVWVENPGYLGARGALLGAGATLIPLPVDAEGLNFKVGLAYAPQARMVYVTPSHQYPLGMTMSLSRRLALLQWANQAEAWVLEDDYDSEYRYTGRPLAALQGLDASGRVIYIGTFSKVLFPALRLGYVVVPADLVDTVVAAAALSSRCPPILEQAVVFNFIEEGHFARHIRRMRTLYAERQSVLVEAVAQRLAGQLELGPAEAGLHVVGWLPQGADEADIARRLLTQNLEAPLVSSYMMKSQSPQSPALNEDLQVTEGPHLSGLMLGYAAINNAEIRRGVRQLQTVLTDTHVS